MTSTEIWHNPRCTTSRKVLGMLEERGVSPRVTLYLETPPTRARLAEVIALMGIEPRALLRKKEELYKKLRLDDPAVTGEEIIDAMVAHPILIERPVVIRGKRAALGRPPEKVLDILGK